MDIAIIGLAGKFPMADNAMEFFEKLSKGYDAVRMFSQERLTATSLPLDRKYIPLAFMEDIEKFDYSFFNISKAEAEQMDPRQRIMLEVVYHLIEDAGYPLEKISGSKTSVFLGDTRLDYYHHATHLDPLLQIGNMNAVMAGRISRYFNLRGRSVMIDTSCSSSLVALIHACEDIILGNATMAIAGAINLNLFPNEDNEGMMDIAAPEGKAKPFSAEANGTGGGEASACVLLKPLGMARVDQDKIYAVIKGFAINQDAGLSASLTAPDAVAQAEVIVEALTKSGVNPETIGYIEAHGTGTKLGDPIEIEGITKAFRQFTDKKQFCAIGSVKSNIGHTDSAAGIVGFLKALLSVRYGVILPSIHYSLPNPFIDFANSPVFVNTKFNQWISEHPRRAGVSSFGMMGTNCHLILEEYTQHEPKKDEADPEIFAFSAKSATSLKMMLELHIDYLRGNRNINLADYAYTLNAGRSHYRYRLAVQASSLEELIQSLSKILPEIHTLQSVRLNPFALFLISPLSTSNVFLNNHTSEVEFNRLHDEIMADGRNQLLPQEVLWQFTYFSMLRERGIDIVQAIGAGTGQQVLNLMNKSEVAKAVSYDEIRREAISDRLRKFLDRQVDLPMICIDPLPDGMLGLEVHELLKAGYAGITLVQPTSLDPNLHGLIKQLYCLGYPIDWRKYYCHRKLTILSAPGYAFEKNRAWLKLPGALNSNEAEVRPSENTKDVAQSNHRFSAAGKVDELSVLLSIWKTVLKSESIVAEDDFFDIGGHSLNAVQVLNGIREELGVSLEIDDLYDFPTCGQMAIHLQSHLARRAPEAVPVQEEVASIWKQVLKLENIHAEDNFFDIGGHSLNATQVINRVKECFHIDIEMDHFYDHQTLSEFSRFIESEGDKQPNTHTEDSTVATVDSYPLSFEQQRLWAAAKVGKQNHLFNMFTAYQLKGEVHVNVLRQAYHALVEKHEILRTNFVIIDHIPRQRVNIFRPENFPLELIEAEREESTALLQKYFFTSFNLETDPLIKMCFMKHDENSYSFAVVLHHILADGWSMQILFNELLTYYEQYQLKGTINWVPLALQYKDYANLQQKKGLNGLEDDRIFWKNLLSNPGAAMILPVDRRPLAEQSNVGRLYSDRLDSETDVVLSIYCKENGVSNFMAILTGLYTLLYHYNGQTDLTLGSTSVGRQSNALEKQIGLHLNLLPLRMRLAEDDTLAELSAKVRSLVLMAIKHQSFPFQQIVKDLNVQLKDGESPLFNVLVEYRNMDIHLGDADHSRMADVTIEKLEIEQDFAKYPLTFLFDQTERGLSMSIEYSCDLFDHETIQRMMEKLKLVLHILPTQSATRLRSIDRLFQSGTRLPLAGGIPFKF